MKEKVVVLNSGGFDSVVLMHHVAKTFDQEIVSVFFDYGQKNSSQESKMSGKVARRLGADHKTVVIPSFDWSRNGLVWQSVEASHENDYVPMRNLVFLSYALSIAESVGATRVYSAIINSGNPVPYNDTSGNFVTNIRKLFKDACGIKFEAPFRRYNKDTVAMLGFKYGVTPKDYFSCNHPTETGKPCGECGDCLALVDVEKHLNSKKYAVYRWFENGFAYSEEFAKEFYQHKPFEMRVHNNNVCNFTCPHCYYGFEESHRPDLTTEEWKSVFDQAIQYGIKNFHFSGKEPMMTKNLWELASYLKERGTKVEMVTNGSLVPRQIDKIVETGFDRVCVSVDSLRALTIRDLPSADPAIKILRENNVNVTVFIDVHKNNYKEVIDIIWFMIKERNVENVFVRPVQYHGAAKGIAELIVEPEQWLEVIEAVWNEAKNFPENFSMVLSQPASMLERVKDHWVIQEAMENLVDLGWQFLTGNVRFFVDFYQGTFYNQVTVTSDGYVCGNGLEMSDPKYYLNSPGNILEHNLDELIQRGKHKVLEYNKNTLCNEGKCTLCKMGNMTDFYCYSHVVPNPT